MTITGKPASAQNARGFARDDLRQVINEQLFLFRFAPGSDHAHLGLRARDFGICGDRQLRAQLAVQQANLVAAKSQLSKLDQMPRPEEIPATKARVEAAEANVLRLLDQYQRAHKLLASRSIGAEEHNILQRQYEEAVHQREQASADLKLLTAGAWEPDKAIARAAIQQAEAQIAQTQTEIERALVRAPVAGRVLQVNVRPGEYVGTTPSLALVVLGDIGSLRIRVDIDEGE